MSYLESISHRTHERPFSIHKTTVYPGMTLVLYLHCHSEMEIFYLNEGEITFVIEDREFKMTAGDAIFIPPNLLHSAYRKENDYRECSFSAFVFAKEMIMEYIPAYCERYFYAVQYQPFDCIISLQDNIIWRTSVIEFLNHIFSFQLENPEEYELMIRGNLLLIWQHFYNQCFSSKQEKNRHNQMVPHLKTTLDYIHENLAENLTLASLSNIASLSESHFCRVFKEFTGFSPFAYINRIRIIKSCEYLSKTNKKTSEIACLCGYNNISYYNRTFHKMMKETPSSYRRNFH